MTQISSSTLHEPSSADRTLCAEDKLCLCHTAANLCYVKSLASPRETSIKRKKTTLCTVSESVRTFGLLYVVVVVGGGYTASFSCGP